MNRSTPGCADRPTLAPLLSPSVAKVPTALIFCPALNADARLPSAPSVSKRRYAAGPALRPLQLQQRLAAGRTAHARHAAGQHEELLLVLFGGDVGVLLVLLAVRHRGHFWRLLGRRERLGRDVPGRLGLLLVLV